MARLLMHALRSTGSQVMLASTLRSWDGSGDPVRQARLRSVGERIAERLIKRYRVARERPSVWFTYHLYHKAPDWLGPRVTRALEIPYVVAEASVAPKQATGVWQTGHRCVLRALGSASAVVSLNPRDLECVRPALGARTRLYELQPFLEPCTTRPRLERPGLRADVARWLGLDLQAPWLLVVAMLRRGDKLASFQVLGRALQRLRDKHWQLVVVGDGPARDEVRELFASFGPRVVFAGLQTEEAISTLHWACDLFVWPALNEAYGMALLEAQSAGLPAVAGCREGVAEIVHDGETGLLTPEGDDHAFAGAVQALLEDPGRVEAMARAAVQRAVTEDRYDKAVCVLTTMLGELQAHG